MQALGHGSNWGITSWNLRTLEKYPSRNENNIGKLQKLHGVIKGMLVHHNHVLYRSNLTIEFSPNLIYSTLDHIIVIKGLLI